MKMQSIAKHVAVELLVVMEVAGVEYAPGDRPLMTEGAANRSIATGKAKWIGVPEVSVPLAVERTEEEPVEALINTNDEEHVEESPAPTPVVSRRARKRGK